MPATIARIGGWLPRGWRDLGLQLALYLTADASYEIARGFAQGRAEVAFANGERIMDLERALNLFFEPSYQASITTVHWMIEVANTVYLNSQFTVALAFLLWMYLFRNEQYYFFRNMLLVSMGIALVGYIGFPTAPPRMFPEYGFVDTFNDHSSINHDSALAQLFINPFAAVPSMHCAVALMIGVTGFKVCRNWFARSFWASWPLLVAWVTVVTANHYWVDAVLGWMVAGLSFLIASRVLAELRPGLWAWPGSGRIRPRTPGPDPNPVIEPQPTEGPQSAVTTRLIVDLQPETDPHPDHDPQTGTGPQPGNDPHPDGDPRTGTGSRGARV